MNTVTRNDRELSISQKLFRKPIGRENRKAEMNGRYNDLGGISTNTKQIQSPEGEKIPNKGPSELCGERHAKIAETAGVRLVGDYDQRRTGLPTGGELVRFECGDTARFRGDFPVYLENWANFKICHRGNMKCGKFNPKGGVVREEEMPRKGKFRYKCQICRD